jgi:hypothetical protein
MPVNMLTLRFSADDSFCYQLPGIVWAFCGYMKLQVYSIAVR